MARQTTLPVGRGLLFIALAAVSWGVGGFVAALLYRHSDLGPIAVSCWRYVGGLLLLLGLRPVVRRERGGRVGVRRLLLNGTGMALYQTAYYVAIELCGVAVATVVTLGSGPVLIALGARWRFGERLGASGVAVTGGCVAGLALLVGAGTGAGSHPVLGIGVALLSAAGYAGVTLLNRASADDPFDAALGGFAVGLLLLLPLALAEGLLPQPDGLATTVGMLAFLGAVPTALAYAMFFAGLAVVRATTASVVALVEPLTATVLGVAVLGERLGLPAAVGAAVLLAGVVVRTVQERDTR
ncbi:DMT family transporter [Micromonospora sp. KC723]|uniref:DMT family transporter n=1 Tax=Micromonospora sp. KC723 TaxID=2530381 RepID=UPI001042EA86|nr:DMT family transporter [Micromonospora sp. KC723]TDB71565.1 DMT family transporter [Micromonospora sp. KC723]